jgi:polyisoprenoid-binding protein YceI
MLLAAPSSQAATAWATDAARSRLQFTATQAGGEFDGAFRRFRADVVFDPADLVGSRLRVEIETDSAATGDKDRDQTLAGNDFFAADRWPLARFEADQFVALGDERFEARGKLTIRDATHEVRVTFRFQPAAGGARADMTGGTTIRRLDFGVGQGEWRDTALVGDPVQIRFVLLLHRQ